MVATLIGVCLTMPIVVFVRIIRPLILVRFGPIRSDVVGHAIFDPAYYLSYKEFYQSRAIDCFYFSTKSFPNDYWPRIVRRNLRVNDFYRFCDYGNKLFPGNKRHRVQVLANAAGDDVDREGIFARTKPVMGFSVEENEWGRKYLSDLGIPENHPFVCLIVRDSAYKIHHQSHIKKDWSYHNFRNSDIKGYEQAVKSLVKRGYWVLRMGKGAQTKLTVRHPKVIDYALSGLRSDFLDIWLMANSFFTVSTGTGIDAVSLIYRKPMVYLDYVPINFLVSYSYSITSPKRLYWTRNGKALTLTESLTNCFQRTDEYQKKGIGLQELTAQEKERAVLEMEARLNGKWETSNIDDMLQEQFWKTLKSWPGYSQFHGVLHPEARIGADFLRRYGEEYLVEL